jgi:hypothetical protein
VYSKSPDDSNKFERGAAIALRCFLFLLAAYIVFHKIFPFALLRTHLADMTGADLLLLIARSSIAAIGAGYLIKKGFTQTDLQSRDRVWCERWTALALGVITIAVGSIVITSLEETETVMVMAHWVANGALWLLF